MNRTTLSLIGAVTALAAVTGVAATTAPGAESTAARPAAERLPVERSTLVCPQPSASELAETRYTAFTPEGEDAADAPGGEDAAAHLLPAEEKETGVPEDGSGEKSGDTKDDEKGDQKDDQKDDGKDGDDGGTKDGGGDDQAPDPVLPLKKPGTPVTATTGDSGAPALTGSADGPFAPGWTVQQTTTISAGTGRGLHGLSCSAPDTDFWFPGASTAEERQDYVHLTNPDHTNAVVDLELYGKEGALPGETGEGITVPARSTVPVLLSTLTEEPVTNVTVHAVARSGRVAAQVQAADEKLGGDWLPPAAVPRSTAVLPGIPADAASVRLAVHATGDRDADLRVRLATPTGEITPAGQETLHVKAGMTAAVDLKDLTRGEAGSLVLSPAEGDSGAPVVAAARVTRGADGEQETAFIPSTAPVERRATAAGDGSGGATLSLLASGEAAKVRVTASAGSEGGDPVSKTYELKAGTTRAVEPPQPEGGKGSHALTVERLSGGEVYAARTLEQKEDGVPFFTVQTLPDDRGTVEVPDAEQDLSVLSE
ncbi:DUF5719 family protein [Streptomyces sp. JJ36]|uniref:DUF5719 family protein n=1 Tax=Streptomyces sp. JJ36 TaxID=2736645 RepID=UPI001F2106DA|nr:DUF5719 family protein [Streptomyces sp. JJ36]MCF6524007.1 hypothetical protein [Streptomyces sp. JJ36]